MPLVAGTHGPLARLVVVSRVKFVPAEAGQSTMICAPPVPTIRGGTLPLTTLSPRFRLAAPPRLSVTSTVKLKAPPLVSEPESTPLVDKLRLGGKLLENQL